MVLSEKEARMFYDVWFPLLDYTNKKYKVNEEIEKIRDELFFDSNYAMEVSKKLWKDESIIDEYMSEYDASLPKGHKRILESWKLATSGKFMLERHLKKGSIFISMDDEANQVYLVSGINSSWKELFWNRETPIILETTLLPFNDIIITDGLIIPYNVMVGSGMKRVYKEIYVDAKNVGIIKTKL